MGGNAGAGESLGDRQKENTELGVGMFDPRTIGRREFDGRGTRYNEQPVAPDMRPALDKIRQRYGTRMAAAADMKICASYLTQILRGTKRMPDWMIEELGLEK